MTEARVWQDLVENLPNGLPEAGDKGLDYTHTWGRTYWGGALFWLLADIEIHKRTNGRRGVTDALRAVNAGGGTYAVEWSVEKVLQIADKGTDTHVLSEMYQRMSGSPQSVDLKSLWLSLGVSMRDGAISFDDTAPLASVRKAICEGSAGRSAARVN